MSTSENRSSCKRDSSPRSCGHCSRHIRRWITLFQLPFWPLILAAYSIVTSLALLGLYSSFSSSWQYSLAVTQSKTSRSPSLYSAWATLGHIHCWWQYKHLSVKAFDTKSRLHLLNIGIMTCTWESRAMNLSVHGINSYTVSSTYTCWHAWGWLLPSEQTARHSALPWRSFASEHQREHTSIR